MSGLRLVLGYQAIKLGNPLAFGRVLRQPLQPAGRPQLLAFGLQRLGVEVGH
jgi:hypothetical protein